MSGYFTKFAFSKEAALAHLRSIPKKKKHQTTTNHQFSLSPSTCSGFISVYQMCITRRLRNWVLEVHKNSGSNGSNERERYEGFLRRWTVFGWYLRMEEIRLTSWYYKIVSHYLQGVIQPRWLFGISSINSILGWNVDVIQPTKIEWESTSLK